MYTLDRGTTEILIRRGIDSSYIARESTNRDPELVAKIISAHQDVLEGLFDFVANRRELTTSYIKELHAALLRHQVGVEGVDQFGTKIYVELKRGAYKEHPNSPTRRNKSVHEYCPPEHVASEMDQLIAFHRQHAERGIPPAVEAAWLHHVFTQIHPFQDGNGRVARSLASLILIKGGFFPLVVHRDDWEKYIDALETADDGELNPLVSLFGRLQKRDLTRAIGRAADAEPVASIGEAVARTRDLLVALNRIAPAEHAVARTNARRLYEIAHKQLNDVANMLVAAIGRANTTFVFRSGGTSLQSDVLQQLAEKLKFQPTTTEESLGCELLFTGQGTLSKLVVSFQSAGLTFRGLIVAVAYFQASEGRPVPLSDDIFRIDYKEHIEQLQPRFNKWLDDCVIRGLAEWRKTLV